MKCFIEIPLCWGRPAVCSGRFIFLIITIFFSWVKYCCSELTGERFVYFQCSVYKIAFFNFFLYFFVCFFYVCVCACFIVMYLQLCVFITRVGIVRVDVVVVAVVVSCLCWRCYCYIDKVCIFAVCILFGHFVCNSTPEKETCFIFLCFFFYGSFVRCCSCQDQTFGRQLLKRVILWQDVSGQGPSALVRYLQSTSSIIWLCYWFRFC